MKKVSTIIFILLATALSTVVQANTLPSQYSNYTSDERKGIIRAATEGMETIEEQVLADEDGIRITVLALRLGFRGGDYELYFLVENDTDEDIVVQLRNEYLNGTKVEGVYSELVNAGSKSQNRANFKAPSFLGNSFAAIGITEVYEIEFNMLVFSAVTGRDIIYTDTITLRTSAYPDYHQQEYVDSGRVYVDQDGFKLVEQGFIWYGWGNLVLLVYAENLSEYDAYISHREIYVNGNKLGTSGTSVGTYQELNSGQRVNYYLRFWREGEEPFDISVIEEVELNVEITHRRDEKWVTISDPPPAVLTFDFPTEKPPS